MQGYLSVYSRGRLLLQKIEIGSHLIDTTPKSRHVLRHGVHIRPTRSDFRFSHMLWLLCWYR